MAKKNKHIPQFSHCCNKWRAPHLQMNGLFTNTAALYKFSPFTFFLVAHHQQQTLLLLTAGMLSNNCQHNNTQQCTSLFHSLYLNPEYPCIFTSSPSTFPRNLSSSLPHHLRYSGSSPTIRLLLKPFQMFLQISAWMLVCFSVWQIEYIVLLTVNTV